MSLMPIHAPRQAGSILVSPIAPSMGQILRALLLAAFCLLVVLTTML
ncbi:hypothetical protein [Beijerinckia indica]|uniref:Uncharacterized protein n=1 Tax=Beijerinckia indica subsp. indica (strain ATCC 9039 / DSM 1715 / NCIMB 8712) TaxID=395963 RepID=B2IBI9_BEII9|nr:hypothetical protein [Beijerinckia indica]ACB96615.1 hypothetical protein Bind_3053 [Beijerinckia indica subsp. indica ATCC 9039]